MGGLRDLPPDRIPIGYLLPLDLRLRRRRDLGEILFRVLGHLDLAAQQLGKLERLAGAAVRDQT